MGKRRRKSDRSEEPRPAAKPLTESVVRKIEEWATEAADAHDLVVFDVEVLPTWVIQIFVDRPNGSEPGKGVTIDQCADVSRYVEGYLDVDETIWPNYTLEVSSPGIERKLVKPRHFELSVGRDVRIVVRDLIDEQNVFEGKLAAFDGKVASVERGADDVVQINWDNIAKARLTHDFSE